MSMQAPTGLLEQHISADIGVAVQQFVDLHRDSKFLNKTACPLLTGIADFWVSRAQLEGSHYHIRGIIPPDEYAVNVSDNPYTNAAASLALSTAYSKCSPDPGYLDVSKRLIILYDVGWVPGSCQEGWVPTDIGSVKMCIEVGRCPP